MLWYCFEDCCFSATVWLTSSICSASQKSSASIVQARSMCKVTFVIWRMWQQQWRVPIVCGMLLGTKPKQSIKLVYLYLTFTIKIRQINVDNIYPTWMIWGNKKKSPTKNMGFFCGWCHMGRERAMRRSWWGDLKNRKLRGTSFTQISNV